MNDFLGRHLNDHASDIWGLVLMVLGVLMTLGIAFNLTGPFGRIVRVGAGSLLGQAMLLLPAALIGVGYVLVRDVPREEPVRIALGSTLLTASVCGLLHLRSRTREWGAPLSVLRRGGGFVGATVAEPLRAAVASGGAFIVLFVFACLGALIIVKVTIREAFDRTADGVRPARQAAWSQFVSLFEIDGSTDLRDESSSRHPTFRRGRRPVGSYDIPIYDDILADDPLPATTGRASHRSLEAPSEPGDRSNPPASLDADPTALLEGSSVFDGGERPAKARRSKAGVASGEPGATQERQAVRITLPPEPEWAEDQPTVEAVALPGLDATANRKHNTKKGKRSAATDVKDIVWKLPPKALLAKGKPIEIDKRAVESLGRTLEEALAAHGVETRLSGMTVGPTVTRYELELAPGVKVARVTALHKDIAYAMATADVRMLAPIPGKSAIGVEVPNRQRQLVAVGDVLLTAEAKAMTAPLTVAIGRDIDGLPVLVDIAKMPHVLVAGTTGSGKSSCINSLLTSILMRATPDQVRMILIDPKMVELSQYNGLPHLLTQVVTNPKKAASALQWAVDEMERRYELLAQLGYRDIGGYNAAVAKGDLDDPYANDPAHGMGLPPAPKYSKLSVILLIIDELADLMMVSAKDVEDSIVRIAQKARAVGIHLVVATQRPSVNVITGLIKANIPGRFAFAVSTLVDSRVIIDQPGAERLIGQGDMLMTTVQSNVPQRVQGNFVSEDEIRSIVGFWKRQAAEARAAIEVLPGVDQAAESGARDATSSFVDFTSDGGREMPSFDISPGGPGAGGSGAAPRYVPLVNDPFAYGGTDELVGASRSSAAEDDDGDSDDLLDTAMELVVRSQLGSTSMLQRKLRVGFSRAGRIMDLLERKGIVGVSVGGKARDVLMTVEEYEALRGKG